MEPRLVLLRSLLFFESTPAESSVYSRFQKTNGSVGAAYSIRIIIKVNKKHLYCVP